MKALRFEWDDAKNRQNQRKHRVSFEEARTVFYDDDALEFFDTEYSECENRFLMLGLSNRLRVLIICHCVREEGDVIRIISARRATINERELYPGEIK
jgi:uncharacterized DUF497 family protein